MSITKHPLKVDRVNGRPNFLIFMDKISSSFWWNSTRKIAECYKELINLNHPAVFVIKFYPKLVENLSKKIHLFIKFMFIHEKFEILKNLEYFMDVDETLYKTSPNII